MKRYGVNHRFSTSYHPQTSCQVENTNSALKIILEKTVKDNPAIWSRKRDDALWAFHTAYKTPTVEYGVSTSIGYGVSSSLSNTAYSSQQINTAYPLPLDTAYRSSGTEAEIFDFRAKFFYLSLGPTDCLSFVSEYSEEEEAEAMAETMEQYMSKTRTDYGSGVARPKIDNKDQFELKGQFLKELRENTFSGSDNEDANEHIEKVLEIVDLFHVPNITVDQLML
ncbi:hypothetical protein Tco_0675797 [Tanacetum coccineum]